MAALSVLWVHFSEGFLPYATRGSPALDFLHTAPRYLNFGRGGVLLFFAISGFVIFGSLRNDGGLCASRRFVITRFFRLYPAYWVAVIVGLITLWWCKGRAISGGLVLANWTMLPSLFGQPYVCGVFWTLETELVFYTLCWALHRVGWLAEPRVLVRLTVGLALLWLGLLLLGNFLPGLKRAPEFWRLMPRHLAIMFWGALFRVVFDETVGFRSRVIGNRRMWQLAALMLMLMCLDGLKGYKFLWGAAGSRPSAYVYALPLFWLWTAWARIQPAFLVWLGRISYSIYLLHVMVLAIVMELVASEKHGALRNWPLWTYLLAAALGTVAISGAIYHLVELPAMRCGRAIAGAFRDGKLSPPTASKRAKAGTG